MNLNINNDEINDFDENIKLNDEIIKIHCKICNKITRTVEIKHYKTKKLMRVCNECNNLVKIVLFKRRKYRNKHFINDVKNNNDIHFLCLD